jgi:hypothetical protein
MFRLLKYLPVVLPVIIRFLRSRKGKATLAKARSSQLKTRQGKTRQGSAARSRR